MKYSDFSKPSVKQWDRLCNVVGLHFSLNFYIYIFYFKL